MIKKAVILSGGLGTRLAPFTHFCNKHLAPVYVAGGGAVPMIDFPIATVKSMGVEEILIITSPDHCGKIVEYLRDGYEKGVDITYKIQEMNDSDRPMGIASALKLAKPYTKDEPFLVILGDNYFETKSDDYAWYSYSLNKFIQGGDVCGLFLYETEDWRRFGVAVMDESRKRVVGVVEKPDNFISNLAVTGMYMYKPEVYDVLGDLKPSKRGELEISDIHQHFAEKGKVGYVFWDRFWSDMGTVESMIKTMEFLNNE